jgi:hypothetical protein
MSFPDAEFSLSVICLKVKDVVRSTFLMNEII